MTTATDHTTAAAVGNLSTFGVLSVENEPVWLAAAREAASAWVGAHGFPPQKDEDWRYVSLEPILGTSFEPSSEPIDDPGLAVVVDEISMHLGGTRLVFVNGHYCAELSRVIGLPEGARVSNLATVLAQDAERLRPYFSSDLEEYRDAFAALNTALFADGVFIELPDDTTVEEPIELVFLTDTGGRHLVTSPRSLVFVGTRSHVTVVETYAGTAGNDYLTNAVTEIVLRRSAQVEHYNVQVESEGAFHLASLTVHQDQESRFSSHLVALGSRIARHEVRILLEGEGAKVSLDGLYLPRGDQHHDHPVLVEHVAPHCSSRQLYKGIADEHGHGVFNGHVVVHHGAVGTDASQTNKNLLLCDSAEIDTRPRLEIFADDVACSHGATVGRLNDDALFYLRSRGIAERLARGLLTYGFARELVDRLELEPLRARVNKLTAERLMVDEDDPLLFPSSSISAQELMERLQ